jgi:trans-aconitate methyltransferase
MAFEFDGEKYKEASGHQKEWGKKLISELALKGDERILDLGCGDGALTTQLAQLVSGGFVLGIDASKGMIDAALKACDRNNLRFELLDINNIDFVNEFNVVFSNATLHWIKDHKRLLANVYRSLKDNGVARLNFAADGNCSCFFRVVKKVMAKSSHAGYFTGFEWPWYMPKIEEYGTVVEQFPFKEKRVWGENADTYFPNVEAMVKWVEQPSLVPFLACVGKNDRAGFRDMVVKRMIDETIQADGTCFETFRRINVFARK